MGKLLMLGSLGPRRAATPEDTNGFARRFVIAWTDFRLGGRSGPRQLLTTLAAISMRLQMNESYYGAKSSSTDHVAACRESRSSASNFQRESISFRTGGKMNALAY